MLDRAIAFAAQKHQGQFDKGGEPYILHCLAVMMKVPKKYQAIAVLHDVVEDCGVTSNDLYDLGLQDWEVNTIITLSKFKGQTYENYVQGLLFSEAAMIVKMADLEHNSDIRRLKGVTEKDYARMKRYHELYILLKEALNYISLKERLNYYVSQYSNFNTATSTKLADHLLSSRQIG